MRSKEEILEALRGELPNLRDTFDVKNIGLFGSYVRKEQTEKSDIDILVEFEKPIGFFKFIELEDHLSETLGVKVEIVTPDALKPSIKPDVIKEVVYA
ncbi:MAG: nucleotidyltransferase family protein [Candidatus Geothermarchaeales archaeon]